MVRIIFLVCLSLLTVTGVGQEVVMGEPFESRVPPLIIYEDNNYFYTMAERPNSKKFELGKVNKTTLNVERIKKIKPKHKSKSSGLYFIQGNRVFGNELHFLFEEVRRKKDTFYQTLVTKRLNITTWDFIGADTLYFKKVYQKRKGFTGDDRYLYFQYKMNREPSIVYSPNKEKILFHKVFRPSNQKYWREEFILENANGEVLKRKVFKRENFDDALNLTLLLDDEGSVYTVHEGQFTFLDYFQDYEIWSEPIPIANRATNGDIGRIFAQFNEKQNLILVAPYITRDESDKNENKYDFDEIEGDTQLEGFALWEIDGLNKEVAMQRTVMLPPSFADKFLTPELIDDGLRPEVHPLFPRGTFEMETFKDGGLCINYEYAFNKYQYRYRKLSESPLFFAGGACEYCFEPNGNLKWAQRIPALVISGGGLGGYLRFTDSTGIHYLMLAHKENFSGGQKVAVKEREILSKEEHALPIEYIMNPETGELSYNLRPELRSKGYLPIFDNSQIIKGEENSAVILFSSFRGRYRWARYDFK